MPFKPVKPPMVDFIVPVIAGKRKDSYRSIGAFEAPLAELEDVLGRVAQAAVRPAPAAAVALPQ